MADRSDLPDDVSAALAGVEEATRNQEAAQARRVKALALAIAGFTDEQIGTQLGISKSGARDLVKRTLAESEARNVEHLREIENMRLDRAQAAIWGEVVAGDLKAIQTYLAISKQRSAINGLNAPTRIEMNLGIRHEMESALTNLESLVLEAQADGAYALPSARGITEGPAAA